MNLPGKQDREENSINCDHKFSKIANKFINIFLFLIINKFYSIGYLFGMHEENQTHLHAEWFQI
jgi:hypothetical protein